MGKIKEIILSPEQRLLLEKGYREGKSHAFRIRCRAILLKAKGMPSIQIGEQLEMHQQSVNLWVNRFLTEGILGLETRPGRGRKPIINTPMEKELIRKAIEEDRSSVMEAKAQFEAATGKKAHEETLRRFLEVLAQDLDV